MALFDKLLSKDLIDIRLSATKEFYGFINQSEKDTTELHKKLNTPVDLGDLFDKMNEKSKN